MDIYCKECGIALALNLKKLEDSSLLCTQDEKAYLPEGYYYDYFKDCLTVFENMLIINTRDAQNLLDHHDDHRLNGCCGYDGCDGKNKLCINGHEVATEKSDCWMAHCIIFDPANVKVVYEND